MSKRFFMKKKKQEKNCIVTEKHFKLTPLISQRKFREIAS